jgi:hypothetical protein
MPEQKPSTELMVTLEELLDAAKTVTEKIAKVFSWGSLRPPLLKGAEVLGNDSLGGEGQAAEGAAGPTEIPPEMQRPRDLRSFLAELSAEELDYLKDGLHQILRSIRAAKFLRRLVSHTLEQPVERFASPGARN